MTAPSWQMTAVIWLQSLCSHDGTLITTLFYLLNYIYTFFVFTSTLIVRFDESTPRSSVSLQRRFRMLRSATTSSIGRSYSRGVVLACFILPMCLLIQIPAKVGSGAAQVQDGVGGRQQRHHGDPWAAVSRDGRTSCEHGNRQGKQAPEETGSV